MKMNKAKSKYYLKSVGFLIWRGFESKRHPGSIFGVKFKWWEKTRIGKYKPMPCTSEFFEVNDFNISIKHLTNRYFLENKS